MPHKVQMNGICRHNNSTGGGLFGRTGGDGGIPGVRRPSGPTLRGCTTALLTGLIGFICGVMLVNWCKVGVSSHCAMKGVCCKEIRISPLGSAQQAPFPEREEILNLVPSSRGASGYAGSSSPPPPHHLDNFIFVGIMTAKKFIDNRGLASHRTWARTINGKVVFFSSEGSKSGYNVPVVALPNVDDRYPPQKKSFMMLKYMHDHYLDKFEWFMRADDDVFIKGDKLDAFLRGINSSQALFIGQAGTGKAEELGKLSLASDENFCMGGPGMIFSRETLRRMAPHISFCLRNLYTTHEDVEIGRCVRKFAGIQCTWSYEMQQILYQNYKEDKGSFKNTLKNKEVQKAVSLHPVKDPLYQYRIYNYLQAGKVQAIHQREVGLHRDLAAMTEVLQDAQYLPGDNYGLGQQPSLTKFRPLSGREVIPWEFISRSIYSHKNSNPRRGIDDSLKSALDELVNQVLLKVNKNAHVRGRTIDFKEIQYGYHRLDPLHGPDYVLDLLLTYRKYRDRKIAMNVRRHAYLQQVFLPIEMKEDDLDKLQGPPTTPPQSAVQSDGQVGSHLFVGPIKSWLNVLYRQESKIQNSQQDASKLHEHIDIIMPLMGRFKIFKRFMENFEKVVLKPQSSARLVLVLYKSNQEPEAHQLTLNLVSYYRETYSQQSIEVIQTDSEFSRGPALQLGAERCRPEALLFFLDVDIIFTPASLQRVRLNTRMGHQVYFPIVFSQFDPKPVCRPGKPSCQCQVGPGGQGSECVLVSDDVGEDSGYWRLFGFGIAALYRSDYHKVGGFDLSIRGWGKEDVDLYTKFIEYEYSIFRAVDPGMTHIFHAIQCSSDLEEAQMVMCVNSKAMSYASTRLLANSIYSNPEILRRLDMHYLNRGS